MRALVQRVTRARVTSEGHETGRIDEGLVALVGVTHDDGPSEADRMADKIAHLRVFDDQDGVMNRSAVDDGLGVLVVSQFTLYGSTAKGRRPSYVAAARPEHAEPLVDAVCDRLRRHDLAVSTGAFRTKMQVELTNDGPVTLMLET